MDAPRRCYVEKRSLSETAIADAVEVVEQMPADERLTAAVVLLGQAQDKVAEWVDANLGHPASTPVGPRIEQPQSLAERITRAINCVSAENGSNTPDFILAEYLTDCLAAFDKASRAREKWYGKALSIGGTVTEPDAAAPPSGTEGT